MSDLEQIKNLCLLKRRCNSVINFDNIPVVKNGDFESVVKYIKEFEQRYVELIAKEFNLPLEQVSKFKNDNLELYIKKHMSDATKFIQEDKQTDKKTKKALAKKEKL